MLREAGYSNGIFKTQITLINKRVGSENELDKFEYLQERVQDELEIMTKKYPIELKLEKALDMYILAIESSFKMKKS